MHVSVRSQLAAGVAAVMTSALALSPTVPSVPPSAVRVATSRVELAAAVKPLVIEPMTPQQIATAHDAIAKISPAAAADLTVTAAAVAPANAASDWLIAGFQYLQSWVAYGVELADYVLQFIPYGYLLGDQISIVYFTFVQPISNSVVYDFLVPVVNDPLNLAAWVNGAVAIGQTVVNAAINTGIAEFNYFFGWLIPPIPPLPLAAAAVAAPEQVAPAQTMALKTAEVTTETTTEATTAPAALDETTPTTPTGATPTPEAQPTAEPTAVAETVTPKPEVTKTPEPSTTMTSGGVSAQGEVRGGTDGTPTGQSTPEDKVGDGKDVTAPAPATSAPSAPVGADSAGTAGTDAAKDTTKDTTKDAGTANA